MKIVIPSNDGTTILRHFGKAEGFVIIEMNDDEIISREYKKNDFTHHAHSHGEEHNHSEHHSHDSIFEAIGDCNVVIGGGMGRRLYNDFEQKQMQVFLTKEESIDTALEKYKNGTLDNNSSACCNH